MIQRAMTMAPDDEEECRKQGAELVGYIHKHPRIYHSDLVGRWIALPFL